VATTAMHGANAPVEKTDWSPLAGKAVLIWPDRDKPGWEYAMQAAQAILSAGAKSCHILYPPEEAAEGWDAGDAVAEGFDVAPFLTHGPRLQMHDVADADEPVVSADESVWGTEDALALAFTRRYHRDWRYVAPWGALAGVGWAALASRGDAGGHRLDSQCLLSDGGARRQPQGRCQIGQRRNGRRCGTPGAC